MTLRLILMRHAKSNWHTSIRGDFERPLNQRGRQAAANIGKWLAANQYLPDLMLCSAAARTRETWALVSDELPAAPCATFHQNLYLAAPEIMFQMLSAVTGDAAILMLAHNPGCAVLAAALAESAPAHHRFEDFPSAATAVIEFDATNWSALTPKSGQVVDFTTPRDQLSNP